MNKNPCKSLMINELKRENNAEEEKENEGAMVLYEKANKEVSPIAIQKYDQEEGDSQTKKKH